jgi:hypothetical protein
LSAQDASRDSVRAALMLVLWIGHPSSTPHYDALYVRHYALYMIAAPRLAIRASTKLSFLGLTLWASHLTLLLPLFITLARGSLAETWH